MPSAHSICWENSAPGLSARRGLPFVHGSLAAPQDKRASLTPEPITLPTDLPVLYRAHISNLVETLMDGEVAGRAGDELHELVDAVVESWDANLGAHQLEIRGKLLEMLQKAKPAFGGGFDLLREFAKFGCGRTHRPRPNNRTSLTYHCL